MRLLHAGPVIVIRPACDFSNKFLLAFPLLFHISVGKIGCCDGVVEHKLIELVNNSTDSCLSS
jgi:hypothetical protein